MSGKDNYQLTFCHAKAFLENRGHTVINPAMLPIGLDNNKYMPICLSMIDGADAIVMIDEDWNRSQGRC